MAKESELDKKIPRFYRRKAYHHMIFIGAKMYMEARLKCGEEITSKEAIEATLNYLNIDEDELSLSTAIQIYQSAQRDFYYENDKL